MENFLSYGDELSLLNVAVRAVSIFFIALFLIRFGGLHIMGRKSGFDVVIVIMLGAVLSRSIVAGPLFVSNVMAATVMVAVNRLLAWISMKSKTINFILKGRPLILYQHGSSLCENMTSAALSKSDLLTSLRLETKGEDLEQVDTAYMEPNGRISFVFKK